jgi:uncharacterized protein YqgC (DUF456 family)
MRVLLRIVGVLCIVLGFLALLTPLTPGSWLMLVGLELLGLGFLMPRRVRETIQRYLRRNRTP